MTPEQLARIQQSQQAAWAELSAVEQRLAAREPGPVQAGDVFVLPAAVSDEVDIRWLVLDYVVDSLDLVRVVPVDSAFWLGSADVQGEGEERARCGWSAMAPVSAFRPDYLVDCGREQFAADCRKVLAKLARGQFAGLPDRESVDADPNYQEHLDEVAKVVERMTGVGQ